VHEEPYVYEINDFLTQQHVSGLMKYINANKKKFQRSFTQRSDGREIRSEHRTSKYIFLPFVAHMPTFTHIRTHNKSERRKENTLSVLITQRACDALGVQKECVEPLQLLWCVFV